MTVLRLLLLLVVLAAPASAQPAASADPQALYDRGVAAAAAGRHADAVDILYQGLEALRAAGRGATPDAGLFAGEIAGELAVMGDDRADDAYRLAVALLQNARDPAPFLSIAGAYVDRLNESGGHDEAIALGEAALALVSAPDLTAILKARAIEMALGAYGAAGRDAEAERVLAGAVNLIGDDPLLAYLRGLARMQIARDAKRDGRMMEMGKAIDGAIADLRIAGEDGDGLRGALLLMRGQTTFVDGDYRPALAAIEEAVPLLEADPEQEASWFQAVALRGRLLERLDRVADALAAAEAAIEAFEKRKGADSVVAIAERLDRIEFLVRAGRSEVAREALDAEDRRLGGEADALVAGFFFERLAAIERVDGNFAAAVDAAERAIEIRRAAFPDVPSLQLEPMRIRADASTGLTDLQFSERAHRELIAFSETIFPGNHPEIARDLNSLAGFLASFRRFDEAEAIERRTLAILGTAYGRESAKYAFALHNLANFIVFNGKADEAISLYSDTVRIADGLPDQDDFRALARFSLASALVSVGRYGEARKTAMKAAVMHEALPGLAKRRLAAVYGVEMQALAGLARADDAIAAGRRMMNAAIIDTYEDATNMAVGMTAFAGILIEAGTAPEALDMARQALAMLQSQAVAGGGAYREVSGVMVGAAWRAAH